MDAGGGSKYPLQVRIRVEPTQGVLQLAEEHARSLLEYRGSFNRFDLRVSKAQAECLAQLFLRMGTPRATMWKTRPYGRPAGTHLQIGQGWRPL